MCEAFDLVWFCIGMVEGSCNIHMELFDTNVIYWTFFVIDDESKVNFNVGQKMHCIVCHIDGINPSHHS
jgi:hypothetical protein